MERQQSGKVCILNNCKPTLAQRHLNDGPEWK